MNFIGIDLKSTRKPVVVVVVVVVVIDISNDA